MSDSSPSFPDYARYLKNRLWYAGCPDEVSAIIIAGTYIPKDDVSPPRCYLAGPMSHCDDYNFKEFDRVSTELVAMGYVVTCPAAMDRAAKDVPENGEKIDYDRLTRYMVRDFFAIVTLNMRYNDTIVLLDGWQMSLGATAEYSLSRWRGVPVTTLGKLHIEPIKRRASNVEQAR